MNTSLGMTLLSIIMTVISRFLYLRLEWAFLLLFLLSGGLILAVISLWLSQLVENSSIIEALSDVCFRSIERYVFGLAYSFQYLLPVFLVPHVATSLVLKSTIPYLLRLILLPLLFFVLDSAVSLFPDLKLHWLWLLVNRCAELLEKVINTLSVTLFGIILSPIAVVLNEIALIVICLLD